MVIRNIREKKHRLPLSCYQGQRRATFTFCTENRKLLFGQEQIVDKFVEILKEAGNKYNCKNWVYIFMPDHIHIVNEGISDDSDLWKMVNLFKQKTGYWLLQNKKEIKWQKDYFDHIHREEENLREHIRYILDNPVRKGLVSDWKDYPLKGSIDFNLAEII